MKSLSTQETIHEVFTSAQCILSKDELEMRTKELEKIKQASSEHQDLDYLYEKAKRIYEESVGQKRERVTELMHYLDAVYQSGKIARLEKTKQLIDDELNALDHFSPFIFENGDLLN